MQHELEHGARPGRMQALADRKLRDEQPDGEEGARPGCCRKQRGEALDRQGQLDAEGDQQHGERDWPDQRTAHDADERLCHGAAQRVRQQQVDRILSRLDERERQIIVSRFGLDHSREPLTLKEVGSEMGVTKERIRQLESRALDKARMAAEEDHVEVPD